MRSQARFTYEEVAAMLFHGDAKLRRKHAQLLPHLKNLNGVFRRSSVSGAGGAPSISSFRRPTSSLARIVGSNPSAATSATMRTG